MSELLNIDYGFENKYKDKKKTMTHNPGDLLNATYQYMHLRNTNKTESYK